MSLRSLLILKRLGRVILTSNAIRMIPFPNPTHMQLYGINHLSLSSNFLSEWSDIDAMSLWFPALETLSLSGNPLMGDPHPPPFTNSELTSPSHSFGMHARPLVIARIPSLLTLDGTTVRVHQVHLHGPAAHWLSDIGERTHRLGAFLHLPGLKIGCSITGRTMSNVPPMGLLVQK
jgi:hypothetical protein